MDGDFGERPSPADRRRLLSSVLRADEFQPLSALVTVEFGAQSRVGAHHVAELTQLTRDHTLEPPLTEGSGPVAVSPDTDDLRHILTDAIGAGSVPPIVDVERLRLCDNDLVLLCSDGLSSALDGETIADVLAQPRTLNDLCQQLIDLAEGHNADDDATAVLARYRIPAE